MSSVYPLVTRIGRRLNSPSRRHHNNTFSQSADILTQECHVKMSNSVHISVLVTMYRNPCKLCKTNHSLCYMQCLLISATPSSLLFMNRYSRRQSKLSKNLVEQSDVTIHLFYHFRRILNENSSFYEFLYSLTSSYIKIVDCCHA